MMDVIPSLDSSADLTSATNVTKDLIMTTSVTIPVMVNGVLPVNEKTVPTSRKPNDPWHVVSAPHPLPSVSYVTGNSLETNVTTITCSDGVSTSSPSATPTKSVQTAVTSTNQTPRYVVQAITVFPTTGAAGENATSAKRRST